MGKYLFNKDEGFFSKDMGNTLQGVGAWFSGKGPEWEKTQAVLAENERNKAQEEKERIRKRAAALSQQMYQMHSQYGPRGVATALENLSGEWQGTPLQPAVQGYINLLQKGNETGDFSELEMQITDDYVKFGGELPEQAKYSATTVNLPGGGTKQTDNRGNVRLLDATGKEITDPQQRARMLEESRAIEQQQAMEVARARAGGAESGKGMTGRSNAVIDRGVEAARAMPILRRTMQLLGEVETGGFEGVARRLENVTGIQSADEAELTANLARSVFSQLRETFGAQFTEKEGKRLERIEAGIGKSTAGNRRIISQALLMNQQKIAAALRAAEKMGDQGAIAEIQQFANYDLGDDLSSFDYRKPVSTEPAAPRRVIDLRGQ